ncbi:MAG: hypothetical protein LBV69_00365 [Bacteroidales bacterium]|jgi:hypothetical protein|nr:hypothetical protein [Bacteroidales bacterium]
MTERQIEKGFWYFDGKNNFPPTAIKSIKDYKEEKFLCISTDDKKEIKEWIKCLPNLNRVKFLWTIRNVGQDFFDNICKMKNLVGLNINMSSVKNIENLIQLESLLYLKLDGFTKIDNISVLQKMTALKVLELVNFKKISDFNAVENLVNLEQISICGSMWTRQKIENLNPLANLVNLKTLFLINTQTVNPNFDPLTKLINLVTICSSLNYPNLEYEKLLQLPKLKYSNYLFPPYGKNEN